jgi:hypothetical protein
MRYEMGLYIPEDILHSDRRENLKSHRCFVSVYISALQILLFRLSCNNYETYIAGKASALHSDICTATVGTENKTELAFGSRHS